ncbi:fungal-specific transcription factor domain-containing protein [Dactylonectria estremocensis]|uniref:Fungal-specific transcription factor domain-containing protein n=1 Tax=Dactylonectria estremocensis TaxID=1079267 RepID=A0A9P9FCF9_9HYPO|nr:fungal-specific transcription factor domain-containing protein [Dactylonectria estremocensis]
MAKPKAASSSASPSPSAASSSRRSGRACKARSLACRECRDRKIRCDGGRPACDSCCRRGLSAGQCVYPEIEHEGSIASSRSYIRVLQKRVQELEAKEQQLTLAARNQHALAGSSPSQDDAWSKPFGSPGPVTLQTKTTETVDHSIPAIPSTEVHAFASGSGSIPMAHDYYAQQPAQMATSPPLTDDLEDVSPIKSSFGSYSTNVKAALMLEKIALPPPELMDDLLAEYFDLDWITMPVVHRQSFVQRYHRLIAVANSRYRRDIPLAEATELATTFCLLLGMLAVGQLSKPGHGSPVTTTETLAATEFHEQARALLFADLIATPSLPVVQALVVHARFLRRSGSLQESWVMAGLAHRLAEGLLLHLDLPVKSLAEREERRRTWCSCVLLIRMQSVAHGGKSTTTSPSFGILPAEVDDEQLETALDLDRIQSPETPSWISFFVHTLKLSDAVLQPIQLLYFDKQTHEKEASVGDILSTTLRLDEALQDWHAALPSHLLVDPNSLQNQLGQRRQALLLYMRYLETKALLSRATIMKLAQRQPARPLTAMSKSLIGGIVEACCIASTELMDLLCRERELVMLAGIPSSQIVISLCVAGMTLNMLLKMPTFSDLIRTPATYADETRRCLSLSKQFYICRHQMAEKYIQVFEMAVQPRLAASPGLMDPALEAKILPSLSGEPTKNASETGVLEMSMLDAWHLGRPELLASIGGFSISEIVSLW